MDIETGPNTWETASSWPLPTTKPVDVYLQGTAAGAKGALALRSGGATDSLTFTDANLSETNYLVADEHAGEQADVPLAAAQARPAHLGHAA